MSLDIGNRLGHDDVTALIGEGGSVCRGQRRIGAFGGELITSPRFAQHPDSLRPGSRPTCLQLCNCSDYPASPSPVSGLDQNSLRHHVENGLGFAGFYSHFSLSALAQDMLRMRTYRMRPFSNPRGET